MARSDEGQGDRQRRVSLPSTTPFRRTRSRHQILVRLFGKHAEEVQHIEQEVLIGLRHLGNELLVRLDCLWCAKVGLRESVPELEI